MSTKILLVQGDNLPRVSLTVTDQEGQPLDLSGCTGAQVHFRAKGSNEAPVVIPCDVDTPTAKVAFEFADGVLDISPGDYVGEVQLSFGAKKHTVWEPLQFKVREQFA